MASAASSALTPARRPSYIIESLMPANEIHLVSGSSGVGKTTFVFDMLNRIRQGLPVLDHPTAPVPFLYVSCDHSGASIRRTLTRMGIEPHLIPSLSVPSAHIEHTFAAVLHHAYKRLHDLQLLVVDAIGVLVPGGKLSDYGTVSTFLTDVTYQCEQNNLTVIGIGQSTKSREGEGYADPRQRIAGSVAWGSFTDLNINIERPDGRRHLLDCSRILSVMPRNAPPFACDWVFDDQGRFINASDGLLTYALESWAAEQPAGSCLESSAIYAAGYSRGLSLATTKRWLRQSGWENPSKGKWIVTKAPLQ